MAIEVIEIKRNMKKTCIKIEVNLHLIISNGDFKCDFKLYTVILNMYLLIGLELEHSIFRYSCARTCNLKYSVLKILFHFWYILTM